MFWYVVSALAIAIAALGGAIAFSGLSRRTHKPRLCSARKLLTEAELEFVRTLEQALNGRYRVVVKTRLADIIELNEALGDADRRRLFERGNSILLDFLLCDVRTFEVLAAIQLERRKRRSAREQQADQFVEDALRAANIHLIRMPLQPGYTTALVATHVESVMSRDFIETLTLTPVPVELRSLIG
jgi:Protein of unknown function (DUF2726)